MGTITKTSGQSVASPSLMKMAKKRDKKDRYSRLKARVQRQGQELAQIKQEKREALRYARLSDLKSEGYVFELGEELEETKDFTDDQFDRHCKRIRKYSKAPVNEGMLPTPMFTERSGKPDKFSKQVEDKVKKLVDEQNKAQADAQRRGEKLPAYKNYYQLRQDAEKLVKGGGEVTKTA